MKSDLSDVSDGGRGEEDSIMRGQAAAQLLIVKNGLVTEKQIFHSATVHIHA